MRVSSPLPYLFVRYYYIIVGMSFPLTTIEIRMSGSLPLCGIPSLRI
jgi:hypothetical protein